MRDLLYVLLSRSRIRFSKYEQASADLPVHPMIHQYTGRRLSLLPSALAPRHRMERPLLIAKHQVVVPKHHE